MARRHSARHVLPVNCPDGGSKLETAVFIHFCNTHISGLDVQRKASAGKRGGDDGVTLDSGAPNRRVRLGSPWIPPLLLLLGGCIYRTGRRFCRAGRLFQEVMIYDWTIWGWSGVAAYLKSTVHHPFGDREGRIASRASARAAVGCWAEHSSCCKGRTVPPALIARLGATGPGGVAANMAWGVGVCLRMGSRPGAALPTAASRRARLDMRDGTFPFGACGYCFFGKKRARSVGQ